MLQSSSNSSQSSFDSSTSPHNHAWFPSIPRHREIPKYPRFYSTPLKEDIPDSTPLQMYGLEEREPSIYERPRRFLRFSRALDDIKEDFAQAPSSGNIDGIRASRRMSMFSNFDGNNGSTTLLGAGTGAGLASASGSSASSASTSPISDRPPSPGPSRMPSFLSPDSWSPPVRRLSRRLSVLSFSQRKARYRAGGAQTISQPNLIGTSNHI